MAPDNRALDELPAPFESVELAFLVRLQMDNHVVAKCGEC